MSCFIYGSFVRTSNLSYNESSLVIFGSDHVVNGRKIGISIVQTVEDIYEKFASKYSIISLISYFFSCSTDK